MRAAIQGVCYDGKAVTFPIEFQAILRKTKFKPVIVFETGGVCYSPKLTGEQIQRYKAEHVTPAGFIPSLKLAELNGDPPRVVSATPTRGAGVRYFAFTRQALIDPLDQG